MEQRTKIFFVVFGISAAVFGSIVGANYSTWSQKLPFGIKLPILTQEQETPLQSEKRVVTSEESAVIKVVEKASPAVVSIVAKQVGFDPLRGPTSDSRGIGTGFIVDANGIILTNDHVVEDTDISYTIVTKDKKTFPVKKIDRDSLNDLAILQVEAVGLPTVELGDSDNLQVGQTVVAIGNALGRFDNTVTVGVISGIGRGVTASDSLGIRSETLENVIQTDAALNPGNSGGPLLDLSARVIGINFAVTEGAQNIGFVIPINRAKVVLEQFREVGRIIKPFLGVAYQLINKDIADIRGLPQGAFVQRVVDNSPAKKAGIKIGDIITKFAGSQISEEQTLATTISKFKVGDSVEIEVFRDGKTLNFKATLAEAENE